MQNIFAFAQGTKNGACRPQEASTPSPHAFLPMSRTLLSSLTASNSRPRGLNPNLSEDFKCVRSSPLSRTEGLAPVVFHDTSVGTTNPGLPEDLVVWGCGCSALEAKPSTLTRKLSASLSFFNQKNPQNPKNPRTLPIPAESLQA